MTTTEVLPIRKRPKLKFKKSDIPAALIYETIHGRNIYFRNYADVLNGEKKIEDIMAVGYLQTIILNLMNGYLFSTFKEYTSLFGEVGIHVSKNNNLSCDLVVYPNEALENHPPTRQYLDIPPKVVIEIDTNGDFTNESFFDYTVEKTRILLQFGTEKVIWILTKPKIAIVATANAPWATHEWSMPIEIITGHPLNLAELFKTRGIE
ncbi:MAG: hypothetical protein RLZZ292_946 [Bacteroidota bacterium]|jgi:hypothetical protein